MSIEKISEGIFDELRRIVGDNGISREAFLSAIARGIHMAIEDERERREVMTVEDEVRQRANELVLRIVMMGDDELMSHILDEALTRERQIAIEGEREACAKIAEMYEREARAMPLSASDWIASAIRARSANPP